MRVFGIGDEMNMSRKLIVGGLHRVLSRSPVVFAVLCAVMLASFSFFNSNKFQSHYGVMRVIGTQAGLRQVYEPKTFRLSSTTKRIAEQPTPVPVPATSSEVSVKSLKELVRDAVERGLVVIVNASDADAAHILADHSHGARLDISGALDGPTGDILVEVMQELRNVEEMANEVAELKRKIKLYETGQDEASNSTSKNGSSLAPLQGGHGFRPSARSLYPLMIFSAFRNAPDEFTAVGVGAPSLLPKSFFEEQENSCTWVEWDEINPSPSPLKTNTRVERGKKTTTLIRDSESMFYAAVVIRCQFADPAGSNSYGGHLFINTTTDDYVAILTEPPEAIDKIQFEGALPHRFAVCTPPIWHPVPANILHQWLLYHHHLLGLDHIHYFFYTGVPLDEATLHILRPLIDQNQLTIIDLSSERAIAGGEGEYPTTLLARNDCIHRARFFADWAMLWDFNEYLQIIPPTQLNTLLASNSGKPYIAFGNQKWSSSYCTPDQSGETIQWATDRMIFRLDLPECHKDRNVSRECVGGQGNRRFIVNPRKVFAVHHHFILDPSWGGADISTEKVRLNQWIGNFLSSSDPICTVVKNPDEIESSTAIDGYWYKDATFAAASRNAHNATFSSSNISISNSTSSSSRTSFANLQPQQTAQNVTAQVR